MKKLLSIITIISIIGLTFVSASAQSVKQVSKDDKKCEIEPGEIYDAVTELEPYVVRLDDGVFRLDAPAKITKKISAAALEQILSGMQITNSLIRDGSLVTTDGLDVFLAIDNQLTVISTAISGGVDKIVFRWYGYDVYLSHATINALIYAAATGGGIATIIASIIPPAALVAGVIAGVVVIYMATITYFDSGNGTIIKFLINGVPFYFCGQ